VSHAHARKRPEMRGARLSSVWRHVSTDIAHNAQYTMAPPGVNLEIRRLPADTAQADRVE
jgi:hypothetical protein